MSAVTYIGKQGGLQLHNFANATDDDIRRYAPSVFATSGHATRTKASTYQHINTYDMIQGMRAEGWAVTAVGQRYVKDTDRHGHVRHMVRMRHPEHVNKDHAMEGVLVNAHDATSSWRFYAGAFRFVCANGHVFGEMMGTLKAQHSRRAGATALELSMALMRELPQRARVIQRLQDITLDYRQMTTFFNAAIAARWPGDVGEQRMVRAEDILQHHWLPEDAGPSAWQIYNHAQRVLVTLGGLQGTDSGGRTRMTRAITRVDENVRVNTGIWEAMLGVVAPKLEPELLAAQQARTALPA